MLMRGKTDLVYPRRLKSTKEFTAWKMSKDGVFSGPYFPVFGLNTEIYGVNLRF